MKWKSLLFIAITSLTIHQAYSQSMSSLVASYPFTGNSQDASGNGHHATVIGATLTTDRFGNGNSAYLFDGINDYMTINHNSQFNFSSYSISLWFKVNGPGTSGKTRWTLISKNEGGSGNDDPFHLWLVYNNYAFAARLGNGINNYELGGVPPYTNDGLWHQSVMVFDNTASIGKIYIDGNLVSSAVINFNPFINTSQINIGRWEGYLNYFNGKMDEIKFYNTALSTVQVSQQYNASKNNLIAYYPFSGNANDSINNLNGTVNGATLTTDRFGNANSAYSFDGINDVIQLNHTFGPYNELTVSAWYKVTANSPNLQAIISSDNSSKLLHMQTSTSTTPGNAIYTNSVSVLLEHPMATLNQWVHLTITTKSGISRIYKNGVLLGESNSTFANIASADLLRIGSGHLNGRFFNGVIDDIRIYNKALSFDDVATLYQDENPDSNYLYMTVYALLQGYYLGANTLQNGLYNQGVETAPSTHADSITVDLHSSVYPFASIYSYKAILNTNGTIQFGFPNTLIGFEPYYIGLRHRNSLEVWGGISMTINPGNIYNFWNTNYPFYGLQKLIAPSKHALFAGDCNQDGNVDLLDASIVEPEILSFSTGYQISDLNGDGNSDLLDFTLLESNIIEFLNNN